MANKRQLKKFIRHNCGTFAAEILMARAQFPEIDRKTVYDIVSRLAALQTRTLSRANVAFDRTRRDSEPGEYSKARSAYYHKAYRHLLDEYYAELDAILKDMNAALPADVRKVLKEAASAE